MADPKEGSTWIPVEDVLSFPGTERFVIRRKLGAGGMGVVYEAFDRDQGALVALKALSRIDAMAVYRFKQEFRALAEIVHPNLVPLYELISDGSQRFFTMEVHVCRHLRNIA